MNNVVRTVATVLTAIGLSGCSMTCADSGELPKVDVGVKKGRMPDVDVDTAEVSLKSKKVDVKVPDVDVKMEKKTVKVPDLEVKMPDEDNDG